MAKNKKSASTDDVVDLLTNILITQLAAAGVGQAAIREVVRCDMNRVSKVAKHISAARKAAKAAVSEA